MHLEFLVWVILLWDNFAVMMATLSCGVMVCGTVEGGLVVFHMSVLE